MYRYINTFLRIMEYQNNHIIRLHTSLLRLPVLFLIDCASFPHQERHDCGWAYHIITVVSSSSLTLQHITIPVDVSSPSIHREAEAEVEVEEMEEVRPFRSSAFIEIWGTLNKFIYIYIDRSIYLLSTS